MNKSELIDHIAGCADLTKVAAGRALDALIEGTLPEECTECTKGLINAIKMYYEKEKQCNEN